MNIPEADKISQSGGGEGHHDRPPTPDDDPIIIDPVTGARWRAFDESNIHNQLSQPDTKEEPSPRRLLIIPEDVKADEIWDILVKSLGDADTTTF